MAGPGAVVAAGDEAAWLGEAQDAGGGGHELVEIHTHAANALG